MTIQQGVDLKPFNSFGVSARARHFAAIDSVAELTQALEFAREENLPVQVLGEGSNMLFVHDFPGIVLRIELEGIHHLDPPGRIRVGAGMNWHELVIYTLHRDLYGLENLALIPGTVGAAPIQNIGAYGVELERFVVSLEAFDRSTGKIRTFTREDCEFAYRDSVFKHPGNPWVVLSVTLQLHTEPAPELSYQALSEALGDTEPTPQAIFDTVCAVRRRKLPDPKLLGNAGSFFKNPLVSKAKYLALQADNPDLPSYPTADSDLVKLPAAWLLDKLGWKGRRRGEAGVHSEHALVLVNLGNATGEDILLLAQEMSVAVLEHFGIALEPEVNILVG